MARFLFLIAATVLAAGQLGHAAPSPAEELRRGVLLGDILRPADTNSLNEAKARDPGGPFHYLYASPVKRLHAGTSLLNEAGERDETSFATYASPVRRLHVGTSLLNEARARDERSFATYASPVKRLHAGTSLLNEAGERGERSFATYASPVKRLHAASGASDEASAAGTTTAVFFREEAVRVGESLPLYFPPAASAALGLLPRQVADSIPFSTRALPGVLAMLGVAPGSAAAARMEETLHECEAPPAVAGGEAEFCATSLEALAERAMAALGTRDVRALASTLPSTGAPLQTYMVRTVRPVDGDGFVGCHPEPYPYTVYRCHATGPARAYMVEMQEARAGAVTVAVVCHTETSSWDPEHVSFRVLGTKPGGAPVCHLMPYGHMIWAKNIKHSLQA